MSRKTKQGKYKFIERYTDPLTGKYRRVSIVLEKNTAQARKQAQGALQERIEVSIAPKKSSINLSQLVNLYYNEQKETLKPSTYDRNHNVCMSIAKTLGNDILVENINAGYIKKCFLSSGKSPVTLNEWLIRLKALLRWGYKNDYII
ncbi:MAG TPA: hypothetical protein IAA26_08550 [Candidatus Blautia faecipullorum]|nr:hypothetical protein [Candidatus Blautia faecipullorum]